MASEVVQMVADGTVLEGTWEEIESHSRDLAGRRVRVTVLPAELGPEPGGKDRRPIEEVIQEIFSEVPDEDWAGLPADLSENLDHYLYGSPKRS